MRKNDKKRADFTESATIKPFKRSLYASAMGHAVVLILISVQIPWPFQSKPTLMIQGQAPALVEAPPIQAVAVDAAAIDAAIARQSADEAAKKAKQAAEKKRLMAEQQRLKAEKQKLEAARIAEQKRLAQVMAEKKAAEQAVIAEKQKAERLKKQTQEAEKKALVAEKARLEKQRIAKEAAAKASKAAALAEAMAAENAQVAQSLSAANLREIDRYKLLVQQQIMRNWFVPGGPKPDQSTQLLVKLAPNGTVLDVRMNKSSGNASLDRSAIAAIYKASPLPVPVDPQLFTSFRELRLTLRPDL